MESIFQDLSHLLHVVVFMGPQKDADLVRMYLLLHVLYLRILYVILQNLKDAVEVVEQNLFLLLIVWMSLFSSHLVLSLIVNDGKKGSFPININFITYIIFHLKKWIQ